MSIADVDYLKAQEECQIMAKDLLSIMQPLIQCYSPSGKEEKIAKVIRDYIKGNCPGWVGFSDRDIVPEGIGNVLAIPEKYVDESKKIDFACTKNLPILMAHMDMVSKSTREQLSAYTFPDSINDHGIVGGDQDFVLGFDDKAGIALILYLMKTCQEPNFKVLFTVQEEKTEKSELRVDRTGGGGIQYALNKYKEFFDTSLWTIMVDRAENAAFLDESGNRQYPILTEGIREWPSDIINWYCDHDTCSPVFKEKIEEISDHLGTPMISRRSGAKADTYNIYKGLNDLPSYSSVNLACGGYGEHNPGDYLCIYQTIRTLRVVRECINHQDKLYQASQCR